MTALSEGTRPSKTSPQLQLQLQIQTDSHPTNERPCNAAPPTGIKTKDKASNGYKFVIRQYMLV